MSVTIYEDNAGSIYLHAEGGAVLYEGGIDDVDEEAAYVAAQPDGDEMNWSPEMQHPWNGIEPGQVIGVWEDGTLIESSGRRLGTAGRRYLEYRYQLRLPVPLAKRIQAIAAKNRRSFNREVEVALQSYVDGTAH